MSNVPGIPADWYPDPADARRQRYWNGSTWTEQLRDAVIAPPIDPTGYDRVGLTASYVPFTGRGGFVDPTIRPTVGSANTVAIWLYALLPVLILPHQYFGWEVSLTDFTDGLIHGCLALVTVVLAILLPAFDRSQLKTRGFERTPPAILGLLPPIHMIARTFAAGAGAILVTLVALIVQGVVVAILVAGSLPASTVTSGPSNTPISAVGMTAPFTPEQLAYLLTPDGMERKIIFDAAESSINYESVECEPLSSTDLGAQTTCHGTGHLASYDLLVQVLPNGTAVPFTVVSITPVVE